MKIRKGKTMRRCNALSPVWAAIHGCEGRTNRWHYTTGSFGRQTAEYICPACEAGKNSVDKRDDETRQEYLHRKQAEAGVTDYRTARVGRRCGRPIILS